MSGVPPLFISLREHQRHHKANSSQSIHTKIQQTPSLQPGEMKRSAAALDGPRDKQIRRQDPVSCQFCRTKKLKCDRQVPCSNCRARKLTCQSSAGKLFLDGSCVARDSAREGGSCHNEGEAESSTFRSIHCQVCPYFLILELVLHCIYRRWNVHSRMSWLSVTSLNPSFRISAATKCTLI